jgi:hypothetical protein
MRRFIYSLLALSSSLLMAIGLPLSARAATTYTLSPWTYVGAAGDCGTDLPAGTQGNVVSKWDYNTGNPSPSLRLEKNAQTFDCSSAGAKINGVNGIHLTELNFDYQGYCGAGAPRFNVSASDGFHFIGGCANGTATTLDNGWTHVTFDPANSAQAFPAIGSSATINSIVLILDEQGTVNIDNVSVNDQVIGGPNSPSTADACKNNGYKSLQDENGKYFKNQGQCVSWTQHNVNGNGQGNTQTQSQNTTNSPTY